MKLKLLIGIKDQQNKIIVINARILLYKCIGTEEDLEKAFYWFQKATENEGQSNLCECYELLNGANKNDILFIF